MGRVDRLLTWDPGAKSASFVFAQTSKSDSLGEKMKAFMQKYDKNSDGKIEMAEVSPAVLARSPAGRANATWVSPRHKHPSRDLNEVGTSKPHPQPEHLG